MSKSTKSSKDSLGDRQKRYEAVSDVRLVRRTPVIVRVDGKAFHSLTKGLNRPVDLRLQECMWATAKALCEGLQGAKMAYTQSDEISVLLTDYTSLQSEAAFDYRLQKLCSIAGSIATSAFTREYVKHFPDSKKTPLFDARAFNVPREDVTNYFLWRQQDATRNSISMLAQAHFSAKRLHGMSCNLMKICLFQEKAIEWEECPTSQKRGVCVVRKEVQVVTSQETKWDKTMPSTAIRHKWVVDEDIPIFSQDRGYTDAFVFDGADYEC